MLGSAPAAVPRRAKRARPAASRSAPAQRRPSPHVESKAGSTLCPASQSASADRPGLAETGGRPWLNPTLGGARWRAEAEVTRGCVPCRSTRGWASPTTLRRACVPSRCCGSCGSRRQRAGRRCRTGCNWLRRWRVPRTGACWSTPSPSPSPSPNPSRYPNPNPNHTGAHCSTQVARCGWLWSGCCWGSRRSCQAPT